MKPRLKQAFFLLVLLATACSTIHDVSYDYDREVDLTQLKSYDWLPIPEKVEADEFVVGPVKRAMDAKMQEKGIRAAADPDFLIAVHVGSEEKVKYWDSYSSSSGPYPVEGYWVHSGTEQVKYEEVSLIVDFVDAESKQLIWRGKAKGFLYSKSNTKKDDKMVNQAVGKILKDFPAR